MQDWLEVCERSLLVLSSGWAGTGGTPLPIGLAPRSSQAGRAVIGWQRCQSRGASSGGGGGASEEDVGLRGSRRQEAGALPQRAPHGARAPLRPQPLRPGRAALGARQRGTRPGGGSLSLRAPGPSAGPRRAQSARLLLAWLSGRLQAARWAIGAFRSALLFDARCVRSAIPTCVRVWCNVRRSLSRSRSPVLAGAAAVYLALVVCLLPPRCGVDSGQRI